MDFKDATVALTTDASELDAYLKELKRLAIQFPKDVAFFIEGLTGFGDLFTVETQAAGPSELHAKLKPSELLTNFITRQQIELPGYLRSD
jgi:hypothetical protein